jgi:hypothetical protein
MFEQPYIEPYKPVYEPVDFAYSKDYTDFLYPYNPSSSINQL